MEDVVLVAEDEPYILESLRFLLERINLKVISASDGAQALDNIFDKKPDLVILDVMMQFHTGFDVLKIIRSDPQLKHMKVLVLTAKGQESDRKLAMELGADMFMTKPFSNKELVAHVKQLLKIEAEVSEENT